jgi:ribulose 1,5-bisphosphate synthetase/thiazole synthase
MSQIKNLMRYGATTSNYFKAYYLAKAGVELAITETAIRDAGFQIAMNS